MRKAIYVILLWVLLLGPTSFTAFAKGPADKITISGPGLSEPIEITDAQILEKFSPWSEAFFDKARGILKEPPKVENTYQVIFYLKDESGDLRASYAFEYAPGNPGTIHLPGKGDPWYDTNKGLILRGEDGGWLYASAAWYDMMEPMLEKHNVSITGTSMRSDEVTKSADVGSDPEKVLSFPGFVGATGTWPILWLGIGVAILLAGVLLRVFAHSRK
jgi:hypothetical protein